MTETIEKNLLDLDFSALTQRTFKPSPAAWEGQGLFFFLLLDSFSDGKEKEGSRDNNGRPGPGESHPSNPSTAALLLTRRYTMTTTTRPLLALTTSALMNRDVATISQDTPLRTAAELCIQRQMGDAVVVDADGRCVGMVSSATDLQDWALGRGRDPAKGVQAPTCPYQVKGQVLTKPDVVICTLAEGSCPLQALQATANGRQTAVCLLTNEFVNDWQ